MGGPSVTGGVSKPNIKTLWAKSKFSLSKRGASHKEGIIEGHPYMGGTAGPGGIWGKFVYRGIAGVGKKTSTGTIMGRGGGRLRGRV